jgi:hypothetical protein
MLGKLTQIDKLLIAAALCLGIALLPMLPGVVTGTAAVILCFFVVGALWAVAVLPSGHTSSAVVRTVAVIGCALASGIFGGLLLNFLPSGLCRTNWLLYSAALCVIGYLVARYRGVHELFSSTGVRLGAPTWLTGLKLSVALALLVGAVLVSTQSHDAKDQNFTELWLVPDNPVNEPVKGLEANSPVRATHATLGVKNLEGMGRRYTLVFDSGAATSTMSFSLAPQGELTKNVPVDGDEASASLFLGDSAVGEPYRKVWVARR